MYSVVKSMNKYFGAIVISMFFESDNVWTRVPIWVTGIFTVLYYYRFRIINRTEEYQIITDKSTSKAFWGIPYFAVM